MAFQSVPDTCQVSFQFDGTAGKDLVGSEAQFALYVRDTAAGTPWSAAKLQQVAQYSEAWWETGKNGGNALKDFFTEDWTLTRIVARDLEFQFPVQHVETVGTTGTTTTSPLPASIALWVKFVGNAGAPPADGGVFLNAGAEASVEGNVWVANTHTDAATCIADWRADLNDPLNGGDINWAHVIVSRSASTNDDIKDARAALRAAIAAARRATGVTNTVTSVVGRLEVASQRDRRPSD